MQTCFADRLWIVHASCPTMLQKRSCLSFSRPLCSTTAK